MTAMTDPAERDPLGFALIRPHAHTRPRSDAELGEQIRLAHRLADDAAVSDIECHAVPELMHGQRWYDTRPMLDPREHDPVCIDMAALALRYAALRGLIQPHSTQAHLVRITPKHRPDHKDPK